MKLYLVMVMVKRQKVMIQNSYESEIDLVFADGMKGVIPVFKDYESAKKYAGDNEILEIEI